MKQLTLMFALIGLLFSCSNNSSENTATADVSIPDAIAQLEAQYGADPGNARTIIGPLLAKYEEYVSSPQGDAKMKVDYLLRAGEMAALIEQYPKAIGYYEKVLTDFPNSEKVATALFMKGYTLDAKLKKFDDAKTVYELFLEMYPDNDFADDTQFLLKNLGKSDEEIIKQFETEAGE